MQISDIVSLKSIVGSQLIVSFAFDISIPSSSLISSLSTSNCKDFLNFSSDSFEIVLVISNNDICFPEPIFNTSGQFHVAFPLVLLWH